IRWWHSTDLMATVGRIKSEYEETHFDMRPCEILIDVIGLGAGVYDRCKELGLPVKAINVGEAAAIGLCALPLLTVLQSGTAECATFHGATMLRQAKSCSSSERTTRPVSARST